MCKTRMSVMTQDARKGFVNIMTSLIEKSTDVKLLKVLTKIVEEWVKSKVRIFDCCDRRYAYFQLTSCALYKLLI